MYKSSASIIVNCSIEHTYRIAETYPYFVSFFKKNSRAISQDEKFLRVEVHTHLFKIFPISWEGEGIKEKYKIIHFRQTKGLFKDLKAEWSFEYLDGKTKVTITTIFSKPWLTDFGEKFIGKLVVEKVTERILKELRKKTESITKI